MAKNPKRTNSKEGLDDDDDVINGNLAKNFNYVMGESSCALTILDVADVLQAKYAFISGGKSRRNFQLVTFPVCSSAGSISDDQYRNAVAYLTSIPPLHEADLGFVLIIDRRQDKWGSVKTLLLRISGYFPAVIQKVYLLQPSSFLQKTFADMGLKFLKEDFKFKILMLNTVEELHDHVDADQLTDDLGGSLVYNHQEWIQHRAALEKFSANTNRIGETLRRLCRRLQETEFPNDVLQTETLIHDHQVARQEVREDLESTINHGRVLLDCFRTLKGSGGGGGGGDSGPEVHVDKADLPRYRASHVTAVERLLEQLEETVSNFETFWNHHKQKLEQCLQLRKFEEEFKHLQFVNEKHLMELETMTDRGETLTKVEALLVQLQDFESCSKVDITRAMQLRTCGENFIDENHYAVDCIRPKCAELERICSHYNTLFTGRSKVLNASKDLFNKMEKANKWSTKGVDLLASQAIDKCSTESGAKCALNEIDSFIATAESLQFGTPKEFRQNYDDVITNDMMAVVHQVLERLEDVRAMCNKRRDSLRRMVEKPDRPVQTVRPELIHQPPVLPPLPPPPAPALPQQSTPVKESRNGTADMEVEPKRKLRPSLKLRSKLDKTHSKSSFFLHTTGADDTNATVQQKRRQVMQELIESEQIYVDELKSIVQGYAWPMDLPEFQQMLPEKLKGKKEILFGNLDQIYNFHASVFLKELEECQDTPALVGRRFVAKKEEFKMYSSYCQNKMASEELRKQIGDDNTFFKECQKRLDHRLPLGAYLLRPVQRITQYQLLLGKMLKFCQYDVGSIDLQEALDTMLSVVKHVNDVLHQISIKGFHGSLEEQGRLLMQGSFSVWTEHRKDKIRDLLRKPSCRHIFLYEKSVLFCKKKDEPQNVDRASYVYKNSLLTSQLGLTENVKGDKKKFELWLRDRVEVYIIQATSTEVKSLWVTEVKKVLLDQFEVIRGTFRNASGDITADKSSPSNDNNEVNNSTRPPAICGGGHVTPPKPANQQMGHVTAGLPGPHEIGRSPTVDAYMADNSGVSPGSDAGSNGVRMRNKQASPEVQYYVAIRNYIAAEVSEITVGCGEAVELILVGSSGWWLVRTVDRRREGWMPARYLEANKRRSTCSLQSANSSSESQGISPEDEAPKSIVA